MASTSSDENESSKSIPKNFRVSSTSNEDEDDDEIEPSNRVKLGVKYRKCNEQTIAQNVCLDKDHTTIRRMCPLCYTKQEYFHCKMCVKNGHIVHSGKGLKGHKSESLSEKQQKYLSIQTSLKSFRNRYENLITQQKSNENLQHQIKREQENMKLLQKLVAEKRAKLQTLSTKRDEMHRANMEKRKNLPKYPIKVKELEDYVLDRIEKISKLRERHNCTLDHLKLITRKGIQQLVEYIFPITEVVLKEEISKQPLISQKSLQPEESETIAALADAKNTSYIRGKWVFHGSGISEMQYRIVAPSLPANGDYSGYVDWLSENKDDVPKTAANEIAPSRVNGFRIVGALTYTTQLTQLMSYFLNVCLPYKLAYGDFCKKLNEEQFLRKVSRLNSNILYIAYTQQVKLSTLNENHTLENVLAILDLERSDLGRHGNNEVANAPLVKSVDSLLIGIETATESESEDENSLRLDWEAISSDSPTQQEIMNSNILTPASQQSTIAEGLITAASRISSLLRWIK